MSTSNINENNINKVDVVQNLPQDNVDNIHKNIELLTQNTLQSDNELVIDKNIHLEDHAMSDIKENTENVCNEQNDKSNRENVRIDSERNVFDNTQLLKSTEQSNLPQSTMENTEIHPVNLSEALLNSVSKLDISDDSTDKVSENHESGPVINNNIDISNKVSISSTNSVKNNESETATPNNNLNNDNVECNDSSIVINNKTDTTDKVSIKNNDSGVVVMNNQSDSLRNLLIYNDDDDSNSSDSEFDSFDDIGVDVPIANLKEFGGTGSSSDSDSADMLDGSSDSDDSSTEEEEDSNHKESTGAIKKSTKKSDKLEEDYLPPVPELDSYNKMDLDNMEFIVMGFVDSIIDKLVTIEALSGGPAYDLETLLFIENKTTKKKRPMGEIFDVLGPVTNPLYCVRFNTITDIKDLQLKRAMRVFVAPTNDCTKYVFLKELMTMKGSDASWLDDQEVPADMAEYSDDEKERESRKPKTLKRKHGSLERHRQYEKTMNKCNKLNTRVSNLMDVHQRMSRSMGRTQGRHPHHAMNNASSTVVHPAPFNPSVPPPGFSRNFVTPTNAYALLANGIHGYQTPPLLGGPYPTTHATPPVMGTFSAPNSTPMFPRSLAAWGLDLGAEPGNSTANYHHGDNGPPNQYNRPF